MTVNDDTGMALSGEAVVEVDARGLQCPLPLLKAKQALNKLSSGELLRVRATDVGAVRDFEVFARQTGHTLLESVRLESVSDAGTYVFLLRKV